MSVQTFISFDCLKEIMKIVYLMISFLFLMLPGIATADDTQEIQQLIDDNAGGTVQLEAKTYTVTQFTIPDNTVLMGASKNGKATTTIKLKNECGLGKGVPVVPINYGENIEICYINWDGTQDNQKYVPVQPGTSKRWGQQYNTFIYAQYSKNIHVHHCDFYNNLGDGLRISYCENVEFDHNTGSMGGHDTFFGLRSEGLDIHDNNINPLVNSAVRILDCSHVRIYDNYIEWIGPRDAGPGIQIQHDSGTMEDIEVCNNVIISSWGSGLWLVGKTSGGEDLWLHHNLFLNCGKNYGIYWVGGIIASGYDNALIENNVFDGSYLGAINFYAVNAGWATSATATLKENVFTCSIPNNKDKTGGWGVNNQISKQEIVSSSNCYWNNKAGDVRGCSVSGSDLFIDPKTHETPSGWTWTGTTWQCDSVKPSEMGDYTGGTYDDTEPLTEEEIEEFDSIFDVLSMEFSDGAYIEQGTLNPAKEWTKQGRYTEAWIDVTGYKGQLRIGNKTYIPESPENCAIVLFGTENLAKRPVSQKTSTELLSKDVELTVKLTVKTKYEVKAYKTYKVLGQTVKVPYYKEKSETVEFVKTFDAPEMFPVFEPPIVYVTHYNGSHAIVYTPEIDGIVRVDTSYNGSGCTERRLLGYIGTAENGFKSTRYETIDSWSISGKQMTQSRKGVYIKEPFDIEKLNVTVVTPYDSFKIEEFEYEVIEDNSLRILSYPLLSFLVVIGIYGRAILKVLYMVVGKVI